MSKAPSPTPVPRLPQFSTPYDGPFERVVCDLVVALGSRVERLGPDTLVARIPNGPRVVIVRGGSDVRAGIGALGQAGGDVVLIGGPRESFDALKKALPALSFGGGFHGVHMADDGALRATHPARVVYWRPLLSGSAPPDWPAFWDALDKAPPDATADAVRVNVAIAGLIVAMFALEGMHQALDIPPALTRLGSLVPGRVLAGEPWRVASYAFLHAGVAHIAMNLLALQALGPPLERALGPWRFALLYGSSALAGGALVTAISSGSTVGASGAIWGLMTARLLLMWRHPERASPELRTRAWRSLALNVLISFLPGVSLAGHLGGAVAGVLVALTFDATQAPSTPVRAASVLTSVLLVGGLATAVIIGRVWTLDDPVTYERVAIPRTATTAEIPSGLTVAEDGEVVFGDVMMDRFITSVEADRYCGETMDGFVDGGATDEVIEGVALHRHRWTTVGSDFVLECVSASDASGGTWAVQVGAWGKWKATATEVANHTLLSVVRP